MKQMIIESFEELTMSDAKERFKYYFDLLDDEGTLEFKIVNFREVFSYYNELGETDYTLSEVLSRPRKAVWDDRTVVKELFNAGFYKIWSGKVLEVGPFEVWVKALKVLNPKPAVPIDEDG